MVGRHAGAACQQQQARQGHRRPEWRAYQCGLMAMGMGCSHAANIAAEMAQLLGLRYCFVINRESGTQAQAMRLSTQLAQYLLQQLPGCDMVGHGHRHTQHAAGGLPGENSRPGASSNWLAAACRASTSVSTPQSTQAKFPPPAHARHGSPAPQVCADSGCAHDPHARADGPHACEKSHRPGYGAPPAPQARTMSALPVASYR